MYRIEYLPLAQADVINAVDYLTSVLDAPKAAAELLDELDGTIEQIARFPYACELYRTDRPMRDEIRKAPIKGFVLYYAVFPDRIEIRRFLHGRKNRTAEVVGQIEG